MQSFEALMLCPFTEDNQHNNLKLFIVYDYSAVYLKYNHLKIPLMICADEL